MGLTDPPEPTEHPPGHSRGRSVAMDPEVESLRKELRRLETIVWVLAAFTGFLAVLVAVLLIR